MTETWNEDMKTTWLTRKQAAAPGMARALNAVLNLDLGQEAERLVRPKSATPCADPSLH